MKYIGNTKKTMKSFIVKVLLYIWGIRIIKANIIRTIAISDRAKANHRPFFIPQIMFSILKK